MITFLFRWPFPCTNTCVWTSVAGCFKMQSRIWWMKGHQKYLRQRYNINSSLWLFSICDFICLGIDQEMSTYHFESSLQSDGSSNSLQRLSQLVVYHSSITSLAQYADYLHCKTGTGPSTEVNFIFNPWKSSYYMTYQCDYQMSHNSSFQRSQKQVPHRLLISFMWRRIELWTFLFLAILFGL